IATATEAGALGAVGAMLIAACSRRLTKTAVNETMKSTARLTAMVIMLLIGSTAFTLVFRGLEGDEWIQAMLGDLPGGVIGLLIVANLAIFILGFFIDFFEIAFIIVPLFVPVFEMMGINLVWIGVMIGMNLQTSFLTPPFGFSLFYLRGVAPPEIKTTHIYRGVIPFIVIQVIGLIAILVWPELVTWLIGKVH
ncbi:MAG: TRAP transporter large permease subunit, partial [Verrucomicrobiota bacterium]